MAQRRRCKECLTVHEPSLGSTAWPDAEKASALWHCMLSRRGNAFFSRTHAFCLGRGRRFHAASRARILLFVAAQGLVVGLVYCWRHGSDTAVCHRPEEPTEGLLSNGLPHALLQHMVFRELAVKLDDLFEFGTRPTRRCWCGCVAQCMFVSSGASRRPPVLQTAA